MKKIVYAVLGTGFHPKVLGIYTKEEDAIKALDYWQADFYGEFWIESYKLYNRFSEKDFDL